MAKFCELREDLHRQAHARNAGRRRIFLMSSEENKRIALSIIEALNARDLSVWSQHLAEDYIAELPGVSAP
jgi:hypothetical protein